ncbi:MAG: carbon monoxide dehydrogenase subunit G [Deinococcales bacterium]
MKLSYSGQEQVRVGEEKVWRFITDPQKVAQCLPNVLSVDIKDDNNFDAIVQVAVGPVRGKFKFAVGLKPQPERGIMIVNIKGGGLGSHVDLTADADIRPQDAKNTTLDWRGEATVRGPAATVGGRILDKKAGELINFVFLQVRQKLNQGA